MSNMYFTILLRGLLGTIKVKYWVYHRLGAQKLFANFCPTVFYQYECR